MKKSILAALCAVILMVVGCATAASVPDRLDKFVEKTEKEYKNYTEDDWKKSKEEYDAIVAEWEQNYDSYSSADKTRAMKAMGKYGAMVLEHQIASASNGFESILESIPEKINNIINSIDTAAVKENVEGITKDIESGVEGIIESIDTARLRKSIEGLTESIDTAQLRQKLEALIRIFGGSE